MASSMLASTFRTLAVGCGVALLAAALLPRSGRAAGMPADTAASAPAAPASAPAG